MKDQKTVSNEFHELEYVAKKFNLTLQDVVDAKKATGSNKRDVIYAYLEALPVKVKVEITDEEIRQAMDEAFIKAGHNAYFGNGFYSGAQWMRDQLEGEAKS